MTNRTKAILDKIANHAKAWSKHDAEAVSDDYTNQIGGTVEPDE